MNNANCSSKSSTPVNEAPTPKSVIHSHADGGDGQLALEGGPSKIESTVEDAGHDIETEIEPALVRNSVVRTSSAGGPSNEDAKEMTPGSHHETAPESTTPRTILPKSALNTDIYGEAGTTNTGGTVEDLHRDVSDPPKERNSSLNQTFHNGNNLLNPVTDRDSRQGEDTDDINLEVVIVTRLD